MKRHLKLITVIAVVVLALSGFSQARGGKGGGGSKGGSSGGGGCGKDRSSRSSYNSGYRYTTSGGSSGSSGSSSSSAPPEREPDARVITCADRKKGAVVELTGTDRSDTYTVRVSFLDEDGLGIDTGTERVRLKAHETKRVEVQPNDPFTAPQVDECHVSEVR